MKEETANLIRAMSAELLSRQDVRIHLESVMKHRLLLDEEERARWTEAYDILLGMIACHGLNLNVTDSDEAALDAANIVLPRLLKIDGLTDQQYNRIISSMRVIQGVKDEQ